MTDSIVRAAAQSWTLLPLRIKGAKQLTKTGNEGNCRVSCRSVRRLRFTAPFIFLLQKGKNMTLLRKLKSLLARPAKVDDVPVTVNNSQIVSPVVVEPDVLCQSCRLKWHQWQLKRMPGADDIPSIRDLEMIACPECDSVALRYDF